MRLSFGSLITYHSGQRLNHTIDSVASFRSLYVSNCSLEPEWTTSDNICTDGGTVLGFFDASKPQQYDNSRRVWYVDDPHIERELVKTHDSAVGFYALNGESLVEFTEDEKKERICGVLEKIREQNPGKRILLVLDKHGAHRCEYTRKRAHQLGIDLIFIPSGSPQLNPIEQVWD